MRAWNIFVRGVVVPSSFFYREWGTDYSLGCNYQPLNNTGFNNIPLCQCVHPCSMGYDWI